LNSEPSGSKSSKKRPPAAEIVVVEGSVKKPKFLAPNPPPSTSTRPTSAQIASRLTEAVRQIKKNL